MDAQGREELINAIEQQPGKRRALVLTIARKHPELSARLLAVKITDEEQFSVSEPTVFRILKDAGLICPKPLPELPAAKDLIKTICPLKPLPTHLPCAGPTPTADEAPQASWASFG